MSNISSIDDLLMGVGNSQQPATPEHKEKIQEKPEPVEEINEDEENTQPDSDHEDQDSHQVDTDGDSDSDDETEDEKVDRRDTEDESEVDEYGNAKEHLNKNMRKRLDKIEKEHQRAIDQREYEIQTLRQQLSNQGASKEVQQAVKDFKYDPNEEVGWEQQLSDFVKHTVSNMHSEQQQQQKQAREQHQELEFRKKFTEGMERFSDFREVVGKLPMDDDMTRALRGMSDPTSFIYAAAKRQAGEIERISKLPDPYARMVEMGKLEERMRKAKSTTKAPRPLDRMKEDTTARVTPKQKETTGDDLLAKADAKRLSTVKTRHARNR